MWEISTSQAGGFGIFHESARLAFPWDIPPMEKLNIDAIRLRISQEMEAKGFSRRGLSAAAGLSQSAIRDILDRVDNPGIGTLHAIAEALQIPIGDIAGAGGVPLMGEIGAGGSVAYFNEDSEQEHVPRPPLAPGRYMALVVRGDSMLPKYEAGEIIYVRRDHDGVLPAYIGRYCAVHLTDGGTYLKILALGTQPGRHTLRSLNAADMEDVEVVWASPVAFVKPRD
jgi:transcriptional regulator with XRE-family HTH domain